MRGATHYKRLHRGEDYEAITVLLVPVLEFIAFFLRQRNGFGSVYLRITTAPLAM